MKKRKAFLSLIALLLIFAFAACNKVSYQAETGELTKEDTKTIMYKYTNQNSEGFYTSLDFNISSGKVLWRIVNESNHTLQYEGYVVIREGKKIKAFTYPKKVEPESFNSEVEQASLETFGYIQFDPDNSVGDYTLSIKPISAEGKYTVKWFTSLPKK